MSTFNSQIHISEYIYIYNLSNLLVGYAESKLIAFIFYFVLSLSLDDKLGDVSEGNNVTKK